MDFTRSTLSKTNMLTEVGKNRKVKRIKLIIYLVYGHPESRAPRQAEQTVRGGSLRRPKSMAGDRKLKRPRCILSTIDTVTPVMLVINAGFGAHRGVRVSAFRSCFVNALKQYS